MKKNRLTTISFYSTVAASSKKTLVSKRISTKFRVKRVRASFAPGVNRLMNLYFFVSPDDANPTTAAPTGSNILTQTGQVAYITGDDEWKEFPCEVLFKERGYFIKVYADNTDTFTHTIDVQITLEIIEEEEETVPIGESEATE